MSDHYQFQPELIDQARLLVERLERLSADSVWAHRASGVRGAILKSLAIVEGPGSACNPDQIASLQYSLDYGFHLLGRAAQELIR